MSETKQDPLANNPFADWLNREAREYLEKLSHFLLEVRDSNSTDLEKMKLAEKALKYANIQLNPVLQQAKLDAKDVRRRLAGGNLSPIPPAMANKMVISSIRAIIRKYETIP